MSHVDGRIFWDPALPESTREERARHLRCDERRRSRGCMRSTSRRPASPTTASRATISRGNGSAGASNIAPARPSEIAEMNRLIDWLAANMPPDDGRVSLVHGDYRIDNMIFAFDFAAPARGARLGAVDARPSLRRSRLSMHAVAAAERRGLPRARRARPRGARHSDGSRICRRILPARRPRRKCRTGRS